MRTSIRHDIISDGAVRVVGARRATGRSLLAVFREIYTQTVAAPPPPRSDVLIAKPSELLFGALLSDSGGGAAHATSALIPPSCGRRPT